MSFKYIFLHKLRSRIRVRKVLPQVLVTLFDVTFLSLKIWSQFLYKSWRWWRKYDLLSSLTHTLDCSNKFTCSISHCRLDCTNIVVINVVFFFFCVHRKEVITHWRLWIVKPKASIIKEKLTNVETSWSIEGGKNVYLTFERRAVIFID